MSREFSSVQIFFKTFPVLEKELMFCDTSISVFLIHIPRLFSIFLSSCEIQASLQGATVPQLRLAHRTLNFPRSVGLPIQMEDRYQIYFGRHDTHTTKKQNAPSPSGLGYSVKRLRWQSKRAWREFKVHQITGN